MTTRAEVLKRHGLPDEEFDMEPTTELQGIWRIKVSCKGASQPITYADLGFIQRLGIEIERADPDFAEQCQAAVAEAQRRAKNSH